MPRIDVIVESKIVETPRVLQISGMFDAPASEKLSHEWHADLDIDSKPWNVGLILGPSGSGKTKIAEALFGDRVHCEFEWTAPSMIDDFAADLSVREIADVMNSVGFSTIPSWMKPFRVLSNGEQFRATVARKILEEDDPIMVDEFTSVVDRQVAKIASHAIQRAIRKRDRKFIAVSCHADIEDWLQPDWIFEPATCSLHWRSLRRRPEIDVTISRVKYDAWKLFTPYHYISAELNKSAQCFGAFIRDEIVGFSAILTRPISRGRHKGKSLKGISRTVVLPDFQGLGISYHFNNKIASLYLATGQRTRSYPAHPALVQARWGDKKWLCTRRPGKMKETNLATTLAGRMGGRPNAVFEYIGEKFHDRNLARKIING